MHHSTLGQLLMKRLASNEYLAKDLQVFVDVQPSTVKNWLKEPAKPPRGEKLNKLWYFFAAAGIESPEMAELPEFGGYIGKLMAFGLVSLEEARNYCGSVSPQAVLQIIRGERKPVSPNEEMEELRAVYNEELEKAVANLKARLPRIQDSAHQTAHPIEEPATAQPQPSESAASAHGKASQTKSAENTVTTLASASPDNYQFIRELATAISALHVDVLYALDVLTPEEIATLRRYTESYTLFGLSNALNRMGSTRALSNGR